MRLRDSAAYVSGLIAGAVVAPDSRFELVEPVQDLDHERVSFVVRLVDPNGSLFVITVERKQ